MNMYLVHTNRTATLFSKHYEAATQIAGLFAVLEFGLCRPPIFVHHSGLWRSLEEEVRFVLDCQRRANHAAGAPPEGNPIETSPDAFIKQWEFEKFRNHNIDHLSVGWRKFLLLALFANIQHQVKIFFDAGRQLSPRLTGLLITNLVRLNPAREIVFVEYDNDTLQGEKTDFKGIFDLGDRFSFDLWARQNWGPGEADNNYDHTRG